MTRRHNLPYRIQGRKYPCTISGSNADGSYSIDYDDGDKEHNVKLERLTFSNGSVPHAPRAPAGTAAKLSMKRAKALFEKEFGKVQVDLKTGEISEIPEDDKK